MFFWLSHAAHQTSWSHGGDDLGPVELLRGCLLSGNMSLARNDICYSAFQIKSFISVIFLYFSALIQMTKAYLVWPQNIGCSKAEVLARLAITGCIIGHLHAKRFTASYLRNKCFWCYQWGNGAGKPPMCMISLLGLCPP